MSRKRILFFAESVTMAHFVRPLVLAESLNAQEFEVLFCAPPACEAFLQTKPYQTRSVYGMASAQFLRNIANGSPPFPPAILERYIAEERVILREFRPDLAIGDMRISLPISARLEGVPCASIMNAYWSPYAPPRSIMPALPISRVIPPRWLRPLYNLTAPLAIAYHAAEINRLRKKFGLAPLPADLRVMYTQGEYVLYPDIPEFAPTSPLPDSHAYVGRCDWKPPLPRPAWWNEMLQDTRRKLFISLGSSGALRALPAVFRAIDGENCAVTIATAGRTVAQLPRGAYAAEYLPLSETAAASDLMISHGGAPALYPALSAGKPSLAIPANADQQLAAAALADSGAGISIRVEEASEKRLKTALRTLLADGEHRAKAREWSAVCARYDSAVLFRDFLSRALG